MLPAKQLGMRSYWAAGATKIRSDQWIESVIKHSKLISSVFFCGSHVLNWTVVTISLLVTVMTIHKLSCWRSVSRFNSIQSSHLKLFRNKTNFKNEIESDWHLNFTETALPFFSHSLSLTLPLIFFFSFFSLR